MNAYAPHGEANGYVQDASTNAQTVTHFVTKVIGTVCNVVGTVITVAVS